METFKRSQPVLVIDGLLPKYIVFVKITFRFKECMQRLSFRANQFGDI